MEVDEAPGPLGLQTNVDEDIGVVIAGVLGSTRVWWDLGSDHHIDGMASFGRFDQLTMD